MKPPQVKNFTPLLDSLVKKYGLVTAAVWGRIWRFEQGEMHVCQASHERLAADLGISPRTIIRHLETLTNDGYVTDHTPTLRNKPHTLNTTKKARLEIVLDAIDEGMTESQTDEKEAAAGVTESHTGMTESHSHYDTESHEETIKKQVKKQKSKEKEGAPTGAPVPAPTEFLGISEHIRNTYGVELPECLDTFRFGDAWSEWEEYRAKERKKKITSTTAKLQIKMLAEYPGEATEIIRTAIRSSWLGLFPLKNGNGHASPNGKPAPGGLRAALDARKKELQNGK